MKANDIIIHQLTNYKEDEADDRWDLEEILDHRWDTGYWKGKQSVLIKWKDYNEPSLMGTSRNYQGR